MSVSTSLVRTVPGTEKVMVRLTVTAISAPGTVRTNEALTLTGSIRPRSEGAMVQVEKFVGKQWQLVGQPVTTDAQGGFTFTLGAQPRGIATLRVTVPADLNWGAISSPTFNIIIR